jgi:hypothetical protein
VDVAVAPHVDHVLTRVSQPLELHLVVLEHLSLVGREEDKACRTRGATCSINRCTFDDA